MRVAQRSSVTWKKTKLPVEVWWKQSHSRTVSELPEATEHKTHTRQKNGCRTLIATVCGNLTKAFCGLHVLRDSGVEGSGFGAKLTGCNVQCCNKAFCDLYKGCLAFLGLSRVYKVLVV